MIIEWHLISKEIFVPDCFRKRTRSQRLQVINVLRIVKLYELFKTWLAQPLFNKLHNALVATIWRDGNTKILLTFKIFESNGVNFNKILRAEITIE